MYTFLSTSEAMFSCLICLRPELKQYEELSCTVGQGVHGIFFPCITDPGDISAVVNATTLRFNVMCMPDLPDLKPYTRHKANQYW